MAEDAHEAVVWQILEWRGLIWHAGMNVCVGG